MKYIWIAMLIGVYVAMWCNYIDEHHKVYWKGINFQKVFIYAHMVLLALLFAVSLFMYMKGV